jgi:hypothetical protein
MNFAFGKFKTVAEAAKALNDSGALKKKDHVKIQGLSEREILMAFFNAIEIIDSNDELGDLEDEIFEWYTNAVEVFNEDEEAAVEETNVVSLQEAKESKKEVKEVEVVEDEVEVPKAAKKVQVEDVEEAPKRRGRKPKAEVEEVESDAVEDAPKRRGRKPKVEVEEIEEAEEVVEDAVIEDIEEEIEIVDDEPEVEEEVVEEKRRRRKVEVRSRASKAEVVEAQEPLPVEDVELDHSNIPPKPKKVNSREEPAFTKAMGLMYKASMKGVEISVEELCKKTDAEEIYMKEVRRKMCNVLQFVLDNDLTMDEIQAILDNEPTPVRTGRPVDPMTEKRTIRRRD